MTESLRLTSHSSREEIQLWKQVTWLKRARGRQLEPLSWEVSLPLSERWWGFWHCLLV